MNGTAEKPDLAITARAPDQSEPVVKVRGLVKRYGRHEAVRGVDLDVHRGEIFAFLARTVPVRPRPSRS